MRSPIEILQDYLMRVDEARRLTDEWCESADALRRIELAALIASSREVSRALMVEYREACASRALQVRNLRDAPPE